MPDGRHRLTVFVRGTNGHVYQTTWDLSWSPWAQIGHSYDVIVEAPGVSTTNQFAAYALGRGTNNLAYAFYPHDPIGTALASFVASRADNVTAVVYDMMTGQTVTFRPGVVEHTASTVKVDILATLLKEAQDAGRSLTAREQMLAVPMIEDSLDSAANALWVQLGPAAIGAFERGAGMTRTVPATDGIWGTTTTTAMDRIAMLRQLVFSSPLLTDASRAYILNLMEHVTPSQAWGVSGGVPAGATVALKNGFSIIDGWQINSMGWVHGQGRNYLMAVLTDGNSTEDYGIQTIDEMSSIVWNGLGP
jgi:beta-lactamase class A